MAEYDVFLSYPRTSLAQVRPIYEALKERDLQVWIDDPEIDDFESITRAIREGLTNAKVLLAYYAEAYPTRRACQWELSIAYIAGQREGDPRRRILLVNPEPGTGHIQPADFQDALFKPLPDPNDQNAIRELAESVEQRVAATTKAFGDIQPLEQPQWYGYKGTGYTRFVGRFQAMWQVHSALNRSDTVSITGGGNAAQVNGLGGIGKSLLAEEYALRFGAAYPGGVFWLRAYGNDDEKVNLTTEQREAERDRQLRAFAIALDSSIPVRELDTQAVEDALARSLAQTNKRCLWVVDDLPTDLTSPDDIKRWFAPHTLARTLITTRSRKYGAVASEIDLGVLDPDDAYELLKNHGLKPAGDEEQESRQLLDELGYHALAVDVAAAVLKDAQGVWTFASFRKLLNDPSEDALALAAELGPALPNRAEKSIAAVLLRSIKQLSKEATDVLRLASVLAPAPIPASLISGAMCQTGELEEWGVIRALDELDRLSLIDQTDTSGNRRVHQLVARTMRFFDPEPDRTSLLRHLAVEQLRELFQASDDPSSWLEFELVSPHARELTKELKRAQDTYLLAGLADYEKRKGAYKAAASSQRAVMVARKTLLGERHPDTLRSMNNLAWVLHTLGELSEARAMIEQVLALHRDVLGEHHPDTLRSMNNLAGVLHTLGELSEARAMIEQVLALSHEILGEHHPNTLRSMNNLAGVLKDLEEL